MALKIPSAIVLRQMFPRQTNRTEIGSEAMVGELPRGCDVFARRCVARFFSKDPKITEAENFSVVAAKRSPPSSNLAHGYPLFFHFLLPFVCFFIS